MKRRRPNYWENRYNQHVIAGKIAIATKAINPYTSADEVGPVYRTNAGKLHYSVIGQDYLRILGINVTEL